MITDVSELDFQERVVERSSELPVVVDFWAAWCGPCRALTPALEAAAGAREGRVDLAKVDVDANGRLAQSFGVQGIPAVKAFRDGRVVDEFTGALPPPEVERFFDRLAPSEADRLSAAEDEESLRRALELDPTQADAATKLGRLLLARGQAEEAAAVLAPFGHDYVAAGLAARARLEQDYGSADGGGPAGELDEAFGAWDAGDRGEALDLLQGAVERAGGEERDLLRRVMVAIFTELGPDDPLAREHRRRLAAVLS
ncbi:MAG TPA: tetratricopeptide repeat protein [Thermoleophilaceae bacterium]|nr:tetratricopeptide repeat protein [Thermoleophilaceae bacterium]